jgi:adenine phosphoribosyltransferase
MTAMAMDMNEVKKLVRDIPDFPKPGIIFKDITPILKSPEAFRAVVDNFYEELKKNKIDVVVGIESRGFLFSPTVAYKLGAGFVPVRKKGKLPYKCEQIGYALEYGEAILEIHQDALIKGANVAIIDDLLATGGTAQAAAHLVEKLGGKVQKIGFVVELLFLAGRKKLSPYDVTSLISY